MKPQDLLKKTILAEAMRSSSDFEDIEIQGLVKKAKVEFGDFRKADKSNEETIDLSDEISFLNVSLQTCSRGLDIKYNSDTYRVEHFSKVIDGIFNIFAIKVVKTGRFK